MEPRCYQCNTLLADINAACPSCLPNWNRTYASEVPQPDAPVSWEEQRYLDAQATIAALEETILKMGENAAVVAKDAMAAKEQVAALQARVNGLEKDSELLRQSRDDFRVKYESVKNDAITLQSQLTQRTAELEAIETILDIDSGKTTVDKVRDLHRAFKQVWESYQDASNEMFKAQAELERVRADNKALDKWRADVTVALQRPEGAFFVDVPQHIKDLVAELERVNLLSSHNERRFEEVDKKYKELRTLIAALPKVEGGIETWDHDNGLMFTCSTRPVSRYAITFRSSEERDAYAALLQHRQGMEG